MASTLRSRSVPAACLQLLRRAVGTLLAWSPVWISAILIWQFTTRGLHPAQAERTRLERAAPAVQERHGRRSWQFEVMAAEQEAWDDPVFRERQRRLRAVDSGIEHASQSFDSEDSSPR